jgi:hypothetical protein
VSRKVRRKDAEDAIDALVEQGGEVVALGNGKIPNVTGPGMITVTYDEEEGCFYYQISDTYWEKNRWIPRGGAQGGKTTRDGAIKLLEKFARSKRKSRGEGGESGEGGC